MSFKENLLQKIQINQLTHIVLKSFGVPESSGKIDKDTMRKLLEMGPYEYLKERDLDLYIQKLDGGQSNILVLDNELPIYKTTVEDVVIRKSPYTKEMLSIRNIIKILNDSDVKLSRREVSVKTVQKECIARLDLTFNESDIKAIAKEGTDSLQNGYAEGVKESLALFAELLGFRHPPKAFQIQHHETIGALSEKESGEILFGPVVVFSLINNSLGMLDEKISSNDKGKIKFYQQVAQGKE
ncbi:MAG: hypothetical protein HKO68_17835, partial [Desulfobacterales bacterium]|nr:hypothetical protein [Desulfobacterales bacterium]